MRRLVLGLWLASASAWAWQAQSEVTFSANSKLVQVSVIAQDRLDKPVTGLRREDFRLFDNGKPQEVSLFVAETAAPSAPAPNAPNTFSNQIASANGARSGYSVILFDNLVTRFGDPFIEEGTGYGVRRVLRMLKTIPDFDKVAVYAFGRRLQVIHEFTSDRESIERQLSKWKPSVDDAVIGTDLCGGGAVPAVGILNPAAPEVAAAQARARAACISADLATRSATLDQQLAQIADHLAGIPGRKNLIWMANRFPVSRTTPFLKLTNANVAVYPVDENGVCRNCPPAERDAMQAVAAVTGGVAYLERNDLDTVVRQAIEDGNVSYTLGFYPSNDEKKATQHLLAVLIDRPGVTLRYRTTYLSQVDTPKPADPIADMTQAITRPIDSTAIPIRASLTRTPAKLDLVATLDASTIDLKQERGLWKGKLEVVARFAAADGARAGELTSQTVSLNLRPESYEAALRKGVEYHAALKLPANAVELKLLVGIIASGRIGTLTIPLSSIK